MEESGMKKNKEVIKMKPNVKVSLGILPFGNISYKIINIKAPIEKKEPEMPNYIGSLTTTIENIEIRYKRSEVYLAPKTTAGI